MSDDPVLEAASLRDDMTPGQILNIVGWKMAIALGRVDPNEMNEVHADIGEMLDELIRRATPLEGGQNARRAPFSYTVDPEDPIRWQTVLGEAMGYVSMCWDVTPQGEFDSTNAADAMRKVEAFLMDVM